MVVCQAELTQQILMIHVDQGMMFSLHLRTLCLDQ